jgi:hypothetical protein
VQLLQGDPMTDNPTLSAERDGATSPAAAPMTAPASSETLNDVIGVAEGYRGTAILHAQAHNIAAERFERKNTYLGVPATIIAAVVGSSIFASLSSNDKNIYLIVTTGALSILAAILSALQTFLKYPEIAQSHKSAKDGYEGIRRKIDIFKLQLAGARPLSRSDAQNALQQIANQLDELGKTSPIVSTRALRDAKDDAVELGALVKLVTSLVAHFRLFR